VSTATDVVVIGAGLAGLRAAELLRDAGREVIVDADEAAWAADRSHLVGSTASMGRICAVLRSKVGLSDEEVAVVTQVNPARAVAIAGASWPCG
jgi:succinate dehydrogenase/fumarate reductase flavoprotein subunit